MHKSTAYTPIGSARDGETAHTYFFMINSLLYSRIESGFPSNDEYFDEDVNVYVAGLLASLIDPACHAGMSKYIMRYDIPLFELVRSARSSYTKYQIYKTNADFLLVSLGIFNNPKQMRPHAAPIMEMSDGVYIGRGMAYYRLAQSYCRETFRRDTAVESVLGKLSVGFEKYARILSLMRSEYLNLFRRISSGELYHLGASVKDLGDRSELRTLYDEFLDAYSRHRRDPSPRLRREVDRLAKRISHLDPSFRFENA
jgi:hypothetical protein